MTHGKTACLGSVRNSNLCLQQQLRYDIQRADNISSCKLEELKSISHRLSSRCKKVREASNVRYFGEGKIKSYRFML